MKRESNLFEQICDFENLRLAWLNARKGKTSKVAVRNFSKNVSQNLIEIQKRMCESPPLLSSYVQFKICDPKERIISVVPFSDRVIHHAIINVLEPVFERQFIFHTYACRKGKGTHAAARYAFKCAKRAPYFLKLDVRKYFDSIDHVVLKSLLCRIIKDAQCLELLFTIIDSYEASYGDFKGQSPLGEGGVGATKCDAGGRLSPSCGLPIGNLTSQFFANLYLSSLDHFVLEQLKPKGYVRYMDDMVIFADSMAALKVIFNEVENFCKNQLHLTLKEPALGKCSDGLPFLGWRIAKGGVFLLAKTKRRMKKKLHEIQKDYEYGKISEDKMYERAMAVFAARKLPPCPKR